MTPKRLTSLTGSILILALLAHNWRSYPRCESEASAQITGISGGFIGTLRLSECTGKNRMVCTITMAGFEELESRELL